MAEHEASLGGLAPRLRRTFLVKRRRKERCSRGSGSQVLSQASRHIEPIAEKVIFESIRAECPQVVEERQQESSDMNQILISSLTPPCENSSESSPGYQSRNDEQADRASISIKSKINLRLRSPRSVKCRTSDGDHAAHNVTSAAGIAVQCLTNAQLPSVTALSGKNQKMITSSCEGKVVPHFPRSPGSSPGDVLEVAVELLRCGSPSNHPGSSACLSTLAQTAESSSGNSAIFDDDVAFSPALSIAREHTDRQVTSVVKTLARDEDLKDKCKSQSFSSPGIVKSRRLRDSDARGRWSTILRPSYNKSRPQLNQFDSKCREQQPRHGNGGDSDPMLLWGRNATPRSKKTQSITRRRKGSVKESTVNTAPAGIVDGSACGVMQSNRPWFTVNTLRTAAPAVASDNAESIYDDAVKALEARVVESEENVRTLISTLHTTEKIFEAEVEQLKRVLRSVDQAQEIRYRSLLAVFTDNFKAIGQVEERFEDLLGYRHTQMQASGRGRIVFFLWSIIDMWVRVLLLVLRCFLAAYAKCTQGTKAQKRRLSEGADVVHPKAHTTS
jgi:hypothetical protein